MATPRVYADFNAIEYLPESTMQAVLPLTGYGTLASLSRQRMRLAEGLALILYEPNDIECEGVAHFDATRKDPAGRVGEWVARINHQDIRGCTQDDPQSSEHPCISCGTDLVQALKNCARNYMEHCPKCGESIMTPMAPPADAT